MAWNPGSSQVSSSWSSAGFCGTSPRPKCGKWPWLQLVTVSPQPTRPAPLHAYFSHHGKRPPGLLPCSVAASAPLPSPPHTPSPQKASERDPGEVIIGGAQNRIFLSKGIKGYESRSPPRPNSMGNPDFLPIFQIDLKVTLRP